MFNYATIAKELVKRSEDNQEYRDALLTILSLGENEIYTITEDVDVREETIDESCKLITLDNGNFTSELYYYPHGGEMILMGEKNLEKFSSYSSVTLESFQVEPVAELIARARYIIHRG